MVTDRVNVWEEGLSCKPQIARRQNAAYKFARGKSSGEHIQGSFLLIKEVGSRATLPQPWIIKSSIRCVSRNNLKMPKNPALNHKIDQFWNF